MASDPTMKAPRSGVRIRMYRLGHGDCFLLAFPGQEGSARPPVHVLIDCGYKPGSQVPDPKTGEDIRIDAIVDDIVAATGGKVDVVIVTHEHQDHVNGFGTTRDRVPIFDRLDEIGEVWLAWTEDGNDSLANRLRRDYHDQLIGLAFAEERLGMAGADPEQVQLVSELLELELGGEEDSLAPGQAAAMIRERFRESLDKNRAMAMSGHTSFAVEGITNKNAIAYLRGRATGGVRFLSPGGAPVALPRGVKALAYPLGPPRNEQLLTDLDPREQEAFHMRPPFAMDGAAQTFFAAAAAQSGAGEMTGSPFATRYRHAAETVFATERPEYADDALREASGAVGKLEFMRGVYGPKDPDEDPTDGAPWRRIDADWLDASEALALRLNDEVNNTSLVLAFELPDTRQVLLFTGDAQRGSWFSWADLEWQTADGTVDARDLLGRCTFYKCGHHGSHNATMNGTEQDSWANIDWLGRGRFAEDFVAMIPANTAWARGKKRPWDHPLPAIEEELRRKARGRVFRTDVDHVDLDDLPEDTEPLSNAEKNAFKKASAEEALYLEFTVYD
ncbi:MAG: hypothetical protein AAGK00_09340 [Pseudomonadota bacterium]